MSYDALIGKPLNPQTVVVERGPVSNFAKAVKDESPIYHDAEAAAANGFENVPAPPTYAFAMAHFGAFRELQPPGSEDANAIMEVIGTLMRTGGMVLHGEQEFIYHKPLVVGQTLTSDGKVTDIYEKDGSGGKKMTFVSAQTDWKDETGDLVVSTVMTLLHRA